MSKSTGFSLVELSIILVILGVLSGIILTGQSLIRASELRAVPIEAQKFQTAILLFRNKYLTIPGDMDNAIKFWGDNISHCSDGNGSNNGTPGTCNGNGDGRLDGGSSGSQPNERFMAWNHLSLAGLIEGSYDGVAGSNNQNHAILGENVPRSKLANSGWAAQHLGNSGNAANYAINYDNHLVFGGQTNGTTSGRVLTPEEAWNIDIKIDDGKPAYGNVIGEFWNNDCAAAVDGTHAADDLDSEYKVKETDELCIFRFRQIF